MRRYLLDTPLLAGYLSNRTPTVQLISPWVARKEVATTVLSFGEVVEYIRGLPQFSTHYAMLRHLVRVIPPLVPNFRIMERYADLRRALRPPYGPGLIGDIDTIIAATAMERALTLVTTDSDFQRVPGLSLMLIPRSQL